MVTFHTALSEGCGRAILQVISGAGTRSTKALLGDEAKKAGRKEAEGHVDVGASPGPDGGQRGEEHTGALPLHFYSP